MYIFYEKPYYWNDDCSEMKPGDSVVCNTIFRDYKSLARYVEFTYEEYKTKHCRSKTDKSYFQNMLPLEPIDLYDGVVHVFNVKNDNGCRTEGYPYITG